jgi:hypothetical protein
MKNSLPFKNNHSVLKYVALGIGIFVVVAFVTMLFLPRPSYKTGFLSLPLATQYVATLAENYEMDNDNTIKPEFNKYWATVLPTKMSIMKEKLSWLGSFVSLSKPPVWSPSYFKHQMIELAKAREAAGFKGDTVVKITATPSTKIILFGYVQGAIHSLTRCLEQLKTLGMLNDELKLTSPDYFMVFTGGIISRSPHNMPTLSLVCRLMEQNPERVVYVRGSHETKGYWQEHALKNELVTFAQHLGSGTIPLASEVNAFFSTLPSAAYVTLSGSDGNNFMRISDLGRGQDKQLTESAYAGFLASKSDKTVAVHPLASKDEGKEEVKIGVIFRGEKKRENYQPHDGLRLLSPDMDSVAWATLSSPSALYQKALKFVHDAFVVIAAAREPTDWTVTLYNRDVRTKDAFKATVFNLLTGANAANGSKPTEPVDGEKKERVDGEKHKKTAPGELVEPRPVGVAERGSEQHTQTVALDTTTTSTMAHIKAIQQQLQTLTNEVAALKKGPALPPLQGVVQDSRPVFRQAREERASEHAQTHDGKNEKNPPAHGEPVEPRPGGVEKRGEQQAPSEEPSAFKPL